ncbi:MAG: sarcosine oxidase subunit beta family protein [Alphaproteobacteria bacterium]|nr:sarcosine oxidase subunit beta family protein [Alphaproteobacteria bacterium]
MRYSIASLLRNALSYHEHWPQAWRSPAPKPRYEVVIIGGGGHGLATAYYLAKNHGITDIAVLEKGWIGGGNTGRNTTGIRSNYLHDASAAFYDYSVRLYEELSRTLNYNIMFSQRGLVSLMHSDAELAQADRLRNALHANGIETDFMTVADLAREIPLLDTSPDARYPVIGAVRQKRAGTARHDAVAWAYARAADGLGVHIIQDCAVRGIRREGDRVTALETTQGNIAAGRVAIAVAGHSSVLAEMAGFRLPIVSYALQAVVSEPLKPMLDTIVGSTAVHVYLTQSDKGELVIGASRDGYPSYAQRGSFGTVEDMMAAGLALFPTLGRVKLLRQWAGIVDVAPDASPIVSKTPVANLYISTGWGTGGFKAIPAGGVVFAHTIALDRPHALNERYGLDRFTSGRLMDENAAAAVRH